MSNFSLTTLEYQKLLALVARNAQTPMGRDLLENLAPIKNRMELDRDLRTIRETVFLQEERQVSWTFSGIENPSDAVAILKIKNATLEPLRMLEITRLVNQALLARSVIQPEKENAPMLWQTVEILPPTLFETIKRINTKLLPSGEIDDSASPELARLRREINAQRGRLQKSLESLMRSKENVIQDQIVTQRNDRFVIPVKADFSGKIQGVAHGASSSGATIFIEPLEAIEANNELQKLKGNEEREVARILFSLTEDLREQLPAIEAAVDAVAELDFVKAKTEFAKKFRAVVPQITDDETLDLIEARHPLLEENLKNSSTQKHKDAEENEGRRRKDEGQKNEIVPVSFKLTNQNSVMIISGANAGGKTVVLKTAGLLSLMAVSGLPVPAKDARIPFYRSVLADIGDQQSLSANLSTFSSHISNIAWMMRDCKSPSLVLLDEVGTGTDPEEGSALGVAIVDYFRKNCGSQIVASTHYRGLKIYATNDKDVINASVEFDEKTLQPTYKLLTGMAGASSGIEIARRFGIRDEVIEVARKNLNVSAREAENYLHKLQAETKQAEDLRVALEEEREATALKYASLELEAKKREKERRKEFENKLSETVKSFEHQSKAFIERIEDKALKAKLEKERKTRKAELNRAVLEKAGKPEKSAFAKKQKPKTENRPLAIGDKVLTSFGKVGKVEKIDGKTAEVSVGAIRLREKVKDLQAVVDEQTTAEGKLEKLQKQASNVKLDAPEMSVELNLIGQTTADAEYEIDRFLDEAYMASLPQVRIIHGFGTGALKNFVHHFLKGHPHVSKFGFAPQDQGGNGATIAELK